MKQQLIFNIEKVVAIVCLLAKLWLEPMLARADDTTGLAAASGQDPSAKWLHRPKHAGKLFHNDDQVNVVEADDNGIYLLGLFDIHQSSPRLPFKCGQIELDAGERHTNRPMQNMEAFLWAIEQVNLDKSLLPGVKLGSLVMDTCSSFLRTNQQLANLLHGPTTSRPLAPDDTASGSINVRQIMGLVADNSDWQSVESVASMASALGLMTFVTQSRSTKLSEFARRYRPPASGADGHQQVGAPRPGAEPHQPRPLALDQHQLEGLLGELLGVGKMTTSEPLERRHVSEQANGTLATAAEQPDDEHQHQQHPLLMVRMQPANEHLADAIATLCEQMNWSLVSLVYDDEPDMVDLHDELARQLFARNGQLALDEQVPVGSASDTYEKLLENLGKKVQIGSRVVITLLGTGSARNLLSCLHNLREKSVRNQDQLIGQVNSLLWITVSDREPYYSFATDALGTIAISSSASLLAEFKTYYERLAMGSNQAPIGGQLPSPGRGGNSSSNNNNKWWAEYMQAILVRHHNSDGLELVSNECAKWQEPSASPLAEKCRSLTLSSLVQLDKANGVSSLASLASGAYSGPRAAANQAGDDNQTAESRAPQLASQTRRMVAPAGLLAGQQQVAPLLAKYLAGGWEHNGIEVINSVLAIANGLESIRQALCPGVEAGICDRMRQLLTSGAGMQSDRFGMERADQMPMLSELVYNELLKSTFQLADGRMFSLDESGAGAGAQLAAKVKLYNLRFLRQNSIGFVRFGQFDQQEGLTVNASKAVHYPTNGYRDQTPMDRVVSSCQDERRCLMLDALLLAGGQPAALGQRHPSAGPVSEEELAAGVNSLFKLDHPLISAAPGPLAGGAPSGADPSVRTMRPAGPPLDWRPAAASQSHHPGRREPRGRPFDVVVLLPLHKNNDLAPAPGEPATTTLPSSARHQCSALPIDDTHAFQLLVALAYAQQQAAPVPTSGARHHHQLDVTAAAQSAATTTTGNALSGSPPPNGQQIELTITVIDYCGQVDLVGEKLAQRLDELASGRAASELAAIVDFDSQVSEQVDKMLAAYVGQPLANGQPLTLAAPIHLTIAQPTDGQRQRAGRPNYGHASAEHARPVVAPVGGADSANGRGPGTGQRVKINLLPGKTDEIQALVRLVGSMPNWRLVHLIYTDQHQYRDEFVRRANEANICVSKLIWVPAAAGQQDEYARQLDATRQLFARELHQYSGAATGQQADPGVQPPPQAAGLNSTRLLVVLASSNDATNRLVLEAASQSMLDDYVWVTTHEWLNSVELAHEIIATSDRLASGQLPRHFISTKLETHESREFRHYFAQLTPALHSPIPTSWFDEFWQQYFKCKLPISSHDELADSTNKRHYDQICQSSRRLEWDQIVEDDRVHHTIRALRSLHSALVARLQRQLRAEANVDHQPNGWNSSSSSSLADDFKRHFADHQDLAPHQPLVGFHVVHRLLAASPRRHPVAIGADKVNERRRTNSRNLSQALAQDAGQLVRVGLWRANELIMLTPRRSSNKTYLANNKLVGHLLSLAADDEYLTMRISKSLSKLGTIKSRCADEQTCQLCRQQVGQTIALIKQEEARLSSSLDSAMDYAPKVVSSILAAGHHHQADEHQQVVTSSLDGQLEAASFDYDDVQEEPADRNGRAQQAPGARADSWQGQNSSDDIQASASSLFDATVSGQVAAETRRTYGQFAAQLGRQHQHQQRHNWQPALNGLRQFSGVMMSVLSLIGVACMVASMTYFYPNMLDRPALAAGQYLDPAGGLSTSRNKLTAPDDGSTSSLEMESAQLASSVLGNINDYFMLTGLLMLYSINIAFLLPATTGVCWFRRIGLALSYTVLFGAILVKVLACLRHCSVWARRRQDDSTAKGSQAPAAEWARHGAVEPIDESVELTFESLSAEEPMGSAAPVSLQQQQQCTTTSGQQQAGETSRQPDNPDRPFCGPIGLAQSCDGANLLKIPLALILVQFLVSVVWLLRQPPEPTLYFACWHCSSPTRSPAMFLYEPLLSLLQPAIILVVVWLLAILVFKQSSQDEEHFRLAAGRLLDSSHHQHQHQCFSYVNYHRSAPDHHQQWEPKLKYKQNQLDDQLREAKALVMTTTLLVLTWSLMTLNMISSSRSKVLTGASGAGAGQTLGANGASLVTIDNGNESLSAQLSHSDDFTLVYSNIISGAIVFFFLFIYRLNLFGTSKESLTLFSTSGSSSSRFNLLKKSRTPAPPPGHIIQQRSVLKFNQANEFNQNTGGSSNSHECKLEDHHPVHSNSSSTFLGSQFLASSLAQLRNTTNAKHQQEERLRLQQLNSYGTYSLDSTGSPILLQSIAGFGSRTGTPADQDEQQKPKATSSRSRLSFDVGKRSKAKPKLASDNKRLQLVTTGAGGQLIARQEHKLQRRQSNGSVASSTAKLMRADDSDSDQFDTISCAMSVASNSTSQLQGNDLYPIDCSIQLESAQLSRDCQAAAAAAANH